MKNLICIFFFIGFFSKAQNPASFNNQYTQPSWFGVSDAVFKNSNSYILFGSSDYFNPNGQYYAISSLVVDLSGNYLTNKMIHNPVNNASTYGMIFNKVEKINASQVLCSGQTLNSYTMPYTYYGFPTLIKFNCNTGDTSWLKNYHQMGDSAELSSTIMLTDSSNISFGTKRFSASNSYTSMPFMVKTDKKGNYKWHKWISGNTNIYSSYQKVIKRNDNDFIIIGNDDIDSTFALRIDTNAVVNYKITLSGARLVNDAIVLHDGNILAVGYYFHPQLNGGNKFAYKFDPLTGSKISSRTYNKPGYADAAFSVAEKSNGTILIGGGTTGPLNSNVTTNNYPIADVLTLNSNLDSLCTQYVVNNFNNLISQGYTSGIQIAGDGGYVGSIRPITHASYFWLVKADSTTCNNNAAPFVGINAQNRDKINIQIFPNPASERLNIQLNTTEKCKMEIINTLGQVIYNSQIIVENNSVQINTFSLERGLYLLKISFKSAFGDEYIATKQFIIER